MISLNVKRKNWQVKRLQFGVSILNSNVDKKIIEGETPIELCNYVDVYYNDIINENLDFMEGSATEEEIAKFSLKEGDVIITKDSESADDIGIPAYVEKDFEGIVCGYHLAMFKPFKESLDGKFLLYYLKSKIAQKNFELGANGVTRFGLSRNAIKTLPVPYPPLSEQTQIANFLDQKTAQLDKLIAQKENLLKLLAEKRTAMITQAVTKGLDPDVQMKDSGIKWLGEIPEHWEVWKTTHGFNKIGSGTTPKSDNPEYYNGDFLWVTTSELRETDIKDTKQKVTDSAINDYNLKFYGPGSVIIAMYGATIGRLGILSIKATVNQACCVFDEPTKFYSKFLYYWLWMAKDTLISLSTGGGQPNLSQDDLKQLRIPCPKIEEQKQIASHIEKKVSNILLVEKKIKKSISKLKNYREALITAAVTGQIDIRKEAINE